MNLRNRLVLLVLIMLILAGSVTLVAASETAVSQTTRPFSQAAVLTALNQFAKPDCLPAEETFQQLNFDMVQPVPGCWLLTGTKVMNR